MSEQNVINQLADYGRWIQNSTDMNLVPTGIGERPELGSFDLFEVDLELERQVLSGRTTSRSRRLVIAAIVVAVIVTASLVPWGSEQTVLAASTQDPPGPLYVLPPAIDRTSVNHGYVEEYELGPDLFAGHTVVVGNLDGEIYSNLATISVESAPRDFGLESEIVQLPSGSAQLVDGFVTVASQARGDDWIIVLSGAGEATYVTELLAEVVIGADGLIRLDDASGLVILESLPHAASSGNVSTTYYEIDTDTSRDAIVVETATAKTPLLGGGVPGGEMTATRVQGTTGWQITRQDQGGEWNGVAWQATPNRIVAVSGHVPLNEIKAIAEALQIVDETIWTELLGFSTE